MYPSQPFYEVLATFVGATCCLVIHVVHVCHQLRPLYNHGLIDTIHVINTYNYEEELHEHYYVIILGFFLEHPINMLGIRQLDLLVDGQIGEWETERACTMMPPPMMPPPMMPPPPPRDANNKLVSLQFHDRINIYLSQDG